MGSILALGAQLFFATMPEELKGGRIHLSSRAMGVAMSIIPIISFIYYFSGMQYASHQYATAINLTGYCLTSTIFATACYILLDQVSDRLIMRLHLAVGLIYPFPLWIGMLCCSESISKYVLIVAYTLFCMLGVIHVSTCIYFYRSRLKSSRLELLTESQQEELNLLGRVIYSSILMLFVSLYSPSFFAYPLWLGLIFIALFIVVIITIYMSYRKIIECNINTSAPIVEESPAADDIVDASVVLSSETMMSLEKQLQRWVKQKGFLLGNVTMNDVAKATYTNRTYLSKYVNTTYKCSFKTWITQMRMEEAKKLMQQRPDLSVSDISKLTGFASVESFSHVFTRIENISPLKWRDRCRCDEP